MGRRRRQRSRSPVQHPCRALFRGALTQCAVLVAAESVAWTRHAHTGSCFGGNVKPSQLGATRGRCLM
jgi:hypothetical protein